MPTSESETNTDNEDPPAAPEHQVSWCAQQFRVDSELSTGEDKSGSAATEQPILYESSTVCGDNAIEASANLDVDIVPELVVSNINISGRYVTHKQ